MEGVKVVVCLCGNDGTGKSTLSKLIPELHSEVYVVERSSKELPKYLQDLRSEIKHIDFLTYRYSFEEEREIFEPSTTVIDDQGNTLPVFWVMLHL
jgi:broad-specificity NMP kinase